LKRPVFAAWMMNTTSTTASTNASGMSFPWRISRRSAQHFAAENAIEQTPPAFSGKVDLLRRKKTRQAKNLEQRLNPN
jgi:hypothetical protein